MVVDQTSVRCGAATGPAEGLGPDGRSGERSRLIRSSCTVDLMTKGAAVWGRSDTGSTHALTAHEHRLPTMHLLSSLPSSNLVILLI